MYIYFYIHTFICTCICFSTVLKYHYFFILTLFFSGSEWITWIDGEERRTRRSGRIIDIDLQLYNASALLFENFKNQQILHTIFQFGSILRSGHESLEIIVIV